MSGLGVLVVFPRLRRAEASAMRFRDRTDGAAERRCGSNQPPCKGPASVSRPRPGGCDGVQVPGSSGLAGLEVAPLSRGCHAARVRSVNECGAHDAGTPRITFDERDAKAGPPVSSASLASWR